MRKRGRKSANELSVVPVGPSCKTRPEPPANLSPKEKQQWRGIVAGLREDWFEPENLPLLAEYCRADTLCTRLTGELRKVEVSDPRFDLLIRQKLAAVNLLVRLATKLRLTVQSSTTTRTDKHAGPHALIDPVYSRPFTGWK